MLKSCAHCVHGFGITDSDRSFYAEMGVPEPTHCPLCRRQRRLAFRNERTLYKRQCSGSGKPVISIYPPDVPFPVYDHPYFFSDQWNPTSYGTDFDFSRPFFDQFHDLLQKVPRIVNYSFSNENAEYGNLASWNKDCYMCFEADNNRDCLYADYTYRCNDVVDCSHAKSSAWCYGCVDTVNGHALCYCLNSRQCGDSWFLIDCVGCKNCFGCVNQVRKEYCFFNEQLTQKEYEAKLRTVEFGSHQAMEAWRQKVATFAASFPQKAMHDFHNENSTGDYLSHCKNAHDSFDSSELRDCAFVCDCERIKDGYDVDTYGGIEGAEKVYECHSVGRGAFNVAFGNNVYQNLKDVWYCDNCASSSDLFGCVSMLHAHYCILNKQYSKEDYVALRQKIVDHMKKTGEWGEFFPIRFSPFAYNETVANNYFPLNKERVEALGWRWADYRRAIKAERSIPAEQLPDRISDIPDDVLNWAIVCQATQKPFKLTPRELAFYRNQQLPLPRLHPDERHRQRMRLRYHRKLSSRPCDRCGNPLKTTADPGSQRPVYCEICYAKSI